MTETKNKKSKVKKFLLYFGSLFVIVFAFNVFLFYYYNRPADRSLFLTPVTHFTAQEKLVALTFDDGPSPVRTPPLLDLLAKHQVKATFFMMGESMEKNWEVARRVQSEGHLIGEHTYKHDRMIYKSFSYIENDLNTMDAMLGKLGVEDKRFFRPPFGDKMVALPWELKKAGKTMVTWSVDPIAQYDIPLNAEQIVSQVMEQVQPGAIICLHDGRNDSEEAFLQSVDQIITTLQQQGYTFVTVKEGLANSL